MESFFAEKSSPGWQHTYSRHPKAELMEKTAYKGTAMAFLRNLMAKQPSEIRNAFERQLSADNLQRYRATMAVSTVPIRNATDMYVAAAEVLYPDDGRAEGLRRLGRGLADDNLGGIYRLVVKLLSVQMLIEQCAKLWRTYHSCGDASSKRLTDKHYDFVVRNCPDLPEPYREFVCGFIEGAVTRAGGKDIRVVKGGDLDEWRWDVTWR